MLCPNPSDLFDSVDTPSFFTSAKDEAPTPVVVKKKEQEKQKLVKKRPAPGGMLAPPQLKRPNVSTEDTESWTTKKKAGAKQGKDSKTFKAKEKRKRDVGQTSRGKSYVEEEKRILRESGF
jgi:hypothetical protein